MQRSTIHKVTGKKIIMREASSKKTVMHLKVLTVNVHSQFQKATTHACSAFTSLMRRKW